LKKSQLKYLKHQSYNKHSSTKKRVRNWIWLDKQRCFHSLRKDPIDIEVGEEVYVIHLSYNKIEEGIVLEHMWLKNGKLRYVIMTKFVQNFSSYFDSTTWTMDFPQSFPRVRIKRKPLTRAVLFEKFKEPNKKLWFMIQ
jgi:hypothetical protein